MVNLVQLYDWIKISSGIDLPGSTNEKDKILLWFSAYSLIHHHHVVPLAQISLTLSHHFSLSFIASGRSSGLHPVSSHSCCMYVRAGRPAFAWSYAGVHSSTSLMSSSLLLQQCPACLVRLTWIVFVMGGRWPYSWCLVEVLPPGLVQNCGPEKAICLYICVLCKKLKFDHISKWYMCNQNPSKKVRLGFWDANGSSNPSQKTGLVLINKTKELVIKWILPFQLTTEGK